MLLLLVGVALPLQRTFAAHITEHPRNYANPTLRTMPVGNIATECTLTTRLLPHAPGAVRRGTITAVRASREPNCAPREDTQTVREAHPYVMIRLA